MGYAALQIAVLALVVCYCRMIYRFRWQVAACIKGVVSFSPEEKAGADNKLLYDRFVGMALSVGSLAFGIAAGKAWLAFSGGGVENFAVGDMEWSWADLSIAVASAAWLTCIAVVLLQAGVLKAAGALTLSTEFTSEIILAKKNHLAAAAALVTPFVSMYSGLNPVRDRIVVYVVAVEIAALLVIYTVQSWILFRKQKVSLLVWFLYLCTVEIFPVGLTVLLMVKNV